MSDGRVRPLPFDERRGSTLACGAIRVDRAVCWPDFWGCGNRRESDPSTSPPLADVVILVGKIGTTPQDSANHFAGNQRGRQQRDRTAGPTTGRERQRWQGKQRDRESESAGNKLQREPQRRIGRASYGKANNGGTSNRESLTAGQATGIEKVGAKEKGKSDCPCPCESARIALASRLTAITLGCGGQRGHNRSHECAVLAVAPVSVPSAAQFGDKGGIEPTLAPPANGFNQGNPVNPRDVVLVGKMIEPRHVKQRLLLHGCLLQGVEVK